ncbi:MAG: DNA-directed RNA polymerase subunit alpha [Deinococcota bacterium]
MQIQPEFIANVTDQYGEFIVEPLPRGYGVTLGNPLRRILLSSIPGTAVTSVYIEDVLHEFSTIEGVKEDVMQIILNLKELVVKLHIEEPVTLTLRREKAGAVTAQDFESSMDAEIINPDLHIATLTKDTRLVLEVRVETNVGYIPAEVHATKDRINSIPVDAVFTPVRRVAYRVEDTRVGQKTDLDRLVLRVWTDGSVSPQDALDRAVDILRGQLNVFSSAPEVVINESTPMVIPGVKTKESTVVQVGDEVQMNLENLDLSSRVLHSLQEEGIDSVNALLALSEKDLKKVGGVGDKSLEEIKDRLAAHNLALRDS